VNYSMEMASQSPAAVKKQKGGRERIREQNRDYTQGSVSCLLSAVLSPRLKNDFAELGKAQGRAASVSNMRST